MVLKSKSLDRVRPEVPTQAVAQEELVRINLNVPKSVRAAWKTAAVRADKSLTDLIVEAMEASLKKPPGKG